MIESFDGYALIDLIGLLDTENIDILSFLTFLFFSSFFFVPFKLYLMASKVAFVDSAGDLHIALVNRCNGVSAGTN